MKTVVQKIRKSPELTVLHTNFETEEQEMHGFTVAPYPDYTYEIDISSHIPKKKTPLRKWLQKFNFKVDEFITKALPTPLRNQRLKKKEDAARAARRAEIKDIQENCITQIVTEEIFDVDYNRKKNVEHDKNIECRNPASDVFVSWTMKMPGGKPTVLISPHVDHGPL